MVFVGPIRSLNVSIDETDRASGDGPEDFFGADPQLWERVDRYLAGDSSPDERVAFEQILASEPDMAALVGQLRDAIHHALPPRVGIDARMVLQGVRDSVHDSMRSGEHARGGNDAAPAPSRPVRPPSRVWRFAPSARWTNRLSATLAGIALVVGAASAVHFATRSSSHRAGAVRVIATDAGERATLTLRDGSQVMLGPSSTLSIPAGFGDGRRDVTLQGAGYFSVVQAAAAPFTVSTNRTRVRVLGTAFGVRSYSDEPVATVAVRNGRVAVLEAGARDESVALVATANDVARVDSAGTTVLRGAQNVAELLAWTEGRLAFTDVPVSQVLPELARWYDVSFRVTDPKINDLLLTATFDNRSTADLAHALGVVLNVETAQQGRVITLGRARR
jgi:ferric-dicitrate binding protein FerR (iron transport regulator)